VHQSTYMDAGFASRVIADRSDTHEIVDAMRPLAPNSFTPPRCLTIASTPDSWKLSAVSSPEMISLAISCVRAITLWSSTRELGLTRLWPMRWMTSWRRAKVCTLSIGRSWIASRCAAAMQMVLRNVWGDLTTIGIQYWPIALVPNAREPVSC
jgi:hypothetical protein